MSPAVPCRPTPGSVRIASVLLRGLLLFLALVPPAARAQVSTSGFQWVRGAGGSLVDIGTALAVDRGTNAIVAGSYSNTMTLGALSLTNAGASDIMAGKYRPDGSVVWGWRAGGALEDGAGGVAADTNGNVYVTGYFRSLAGFGTTSLQTRGVASTMDVFLAKLDASGNVVWVQQGGGENDDRAFGVATDPDGNAIIVGSFQGTVTFGAGSQLQGAASLVPETFVVKYAPDGTVRWARRFSSTKGVIGYAVAVDGAGTVYVAGEFLGNGTFGSTPLAANGDRDAFILTIGATGTVGWADRIGGRLADGARGVGVDGIGGVVVAGYFSDSLTAAGTTLTSAGRKDVFVARYTTAGLPQWLRGGGGLLDDVATAVAMTSQGQAYVCGYFTTGMTLGSATVQAAGNADAWLGRYTVEGTLDWLARAGGGGTVFDSANGIAVAPSGDVFVAGQAGGVADFGSQTLTVSGAGNVDLFVARRAATLPAITQSPTNLTVLLGAPATFRVQAGTAAGLVQYQWYKDGAALAGETNAVLQIAATVLSSAGQYWVEVRNGEAAIVSDAARLDLRFVLTLVAGGHGQIPSDPFAADYEAGATVQVLAVPDDDAFFAGWTGAISGSDNPASVVMTNNLTVTAVFGSRRLSLDVQGNGTVAASPPGPLYNPGDPIQLTATPGEFYAFLAWADGPTDNPRTIQLGVTNRYTAVFTNIVPVETITLGGVSRTAPVGMPQLLVNGAFVTSGPATLGDSATLELRTSFPGGVLVWSLDGTVPTHSYEGPATIRIPTVVRAAAFSSDFTQVVEMPAIEVRVLPTFVLRVVTAGGGTFAADPVRTRYFSNDVVTLTATPTNGWSFAGWNGDAAGTNPVVAVTMDRDRCVEAVFGTPIAVEISGAGTVERLPSLALQPYGSTVRFLGVPAAGSNFVAWSGALSGTVNPSVLTVTQPSPLVRGLFLSAGNDLPFVLRVNGGGSVLVFPRQNTYTAGQSILLIASQDPRQQFLGFSGDLVEATNRLNVKITKPMVIDANFTDAPVLSMTNCVGPTNVANLRLLVGMRLGSVARVERSTSQFSWSPWVTVTNTLGRVLLSEPLGTDPGETFYQAIRLQ